ncbi:hypothetical protein HDE_13049 [Halotydeus destructor]|nr:hypothetical protein HDE_13049 [Halotydeus destructor]
MCRRTSRTLTGQLFDMIITRLITLVILIRTSLEEDVICSKTPDDISIEKKLRVYSDKYVFETKPKLYNGLPDLNRKRLNEDLKSYHFDRTTIGAVATAPSGSRHYFVKDAIKGWRDCHEIQASVKCVPLKLDPEEITDVTSSMYYKKLRFVSFQVISGPEYQVYGANTKINVTGEGVRRNPTSISFYREADEGSEFVVFFGHVFTVQVLKVPHDLPIVFRSDLDYQMAKTWLFCPPDLCFDSRVDYAYQEKESMVIGRGKFFWKLKLEPSSPSVSQPQESVIHQEIVKFGKELIKIQDGIVTRESLNSWHSTTLKDVFSGTKFVDVDSAFRYPNTENKLMLIITSGSDLEVYEPDHGQNNLKLSETPVSSVIQESSKAGFDAGSLSRDTTLYLFKNNFYYKYNAISESLSGPHLTQGSLFSCNSSFYRTSEASKQLNITDITELKNYRQQFAPPTYKASPTKSTASSPNQIQAQQRHLHLAR